VDVPSLRVFVYDDIIGRGAVPTAADVAVRFGVSRDAALAAVRGAGIGKALLADPATGEIWMAGPFSARPTPYRVRAHGRAWWANCAWDLLGVASLVGGPAELEASCTDCGAPMPMRLGTDAEAGPEGAGEAVVHFLVPARRWYEDIGFT
jgi:hypothetical protein